MLHAKQLGDVNEKPGNAPHGVSSPLDVPMKIFSQVAIYSPLEPLSLKTSEIVSLGLREPEGSSPNV